MEKSGGNSNTTDLTYIDNEIYSMQVEQYGKLLTNTAEELSEASAHGHGGVFEYI